MGVRPPRWRWSISTSTGQAAGTGLRQRATRRVAPAAGNHHRLSSVEQGMNRRTFLLVLSAPALAGVLHGCGEPGRPAAPGSSTPGTADPRTLLRSNLARVPADQLDA